MKIDKALKTTFRPEFINRIDEIIMFTKLSIEEMEEIIRLVTSKIKGKLDRND